MLHLCCRVVTSFNLNLSVVVWDLPALYPWFSSKAARKYAVLIMWSMSSFQFYLPFTCTYFWSLHYRKKSLPLPLQLYMGISPRRGFLLRMCVRLGFGQNIEERPFDKSLPERLSILFLVSRAKTRFIVSQRLNLMGEEGNLLLFSTLHSFQFKIFCL